MPVECIAQVANEGQHPFKLPVQALSACHMAWSRSLSSKVKGVCAYVSCSSYSKSMCLWSEQKYFSLGYFYGASKQGRLLTFLKYAEYNDQG